MKSFFAVLAISAILFASIISAPTAESRTHSMDNPGYGYDVKRHEIQEPVDTPSKTSKSNVGKTSEVTHAKNVSTDAPGYGYNEQRSEKPATKSSTKKRTPTKAQPKKTQPAATRKPTAQPKKTPVAHPPTTPVAKPFELPPNWACDHIGLFKSGVPFEEKCAIASAKCEGDFVNFYKIFYCGFGQSMVALIFFYLLLIFFIFKYTSNVVEEYIAEGITKISDALGFSEALAAVTLLALANGAGDVITALVAGDAPGGVSYNIGALYGAGLFVAVMVVAICIYMSEDAIKFDPGIIYRDIGFYILSTVVTFVFAWVGTITWWEAVIFLGIYVAMVVTVVISDSLKKPNTDVQEPLQVANANEDEEDRKQTNAKLANDKKVLWANMGKVGTGEHDADTNKQIMQALVLGMASFLSQKEKFLKEQRETEFASRSFFAKVMYVFDMPYIVLLWLTGVPVEAEHFSWTRCMVYPIPGMYFMTWTFTQQWYGMIYLEVTLPLVVLLYLLFALGIKDRQAPKWFMFFTCLGVVVGLMYTYIFVGILIDMLNTLGVLLGLDNTYLGLTILAIGNALPDALTTIALVKQGAGTMAISGGYAGQLFGLLVGFGLSMLKVTLTKGPQAFDLFNMEMIDQNILSLLVVITALVALLLTFFWGVCNNFRMTKTFATIAVIIYGVFILASSVIAIRKAIINY